MRFAVAIVVTLLVFAGSSAPSPGFRQIDIPDPPGKPITIGIWYPSNAHTSPQRVGPFQQNVALNATITGTELPVVFISHGTSGSLGSHYDTALALAQAGFVVVALTHTGDNSQDQSRTGSRINLTDRPRQLKQVIGFVLEEWTERTHIDANKVGVFGFSLGGFTAMVEAGGVPDLSRMTQLCEERPTAPECSFNGQRGGGISAPINEDPPVWVHDSRIRAAVIAAPAVSYSFGADGLKQVTIPIQLWRAVLDDQAPHEWNSAVVQKGLPTPPDLHTVPNAGHYAFLPPCSDALRQAVPSICVDGPGFDRVSFHKQFNQHVVAFFAHTLRGKP
ncbi:MAG TPA: dienelactone hydrolase family protein [Candidatus Acidoferrum sp.]|nr:dienelactone hydrolase family protein [Candidatus Acidoferrum sp.]